MCWQRNLSESPFEWLKGVFISRFAGLPIR